MDLYCLEIYSNFRRTHWVQDVGTVASSVFWAVCPTWILWWVLSLFLHYSFLPDLADILSFPSVLEPEFCWQLKTDLQGTAFPILHLHFLFCRAAFPQNRLLLLSGSRDSHYGSCPLPSSCFSRGIYVRQDSKVNCNCCFASKKLATSESARVHLSPAIHSPIIQPRQTTNPRWG